MRPWLALAIAVGAVACGDDASPARDAATTDDSAATTDTSGDATPDDTALATDAATSDSGAIDDAGDAAEVLPSTEPIGDDVVPCDEPRYWPYALTSATRPVRVHYRTPAEEATARNVIGYVEFVWQVEIDELGFRAPLPDAVRCGPDAKLDIFLWRDVSAPYTDILGSNPATATDDAPVYIVLDTRGFTAGAYLDSTVAHEFNHALQAAYDWTDSTIIYEATATFIEDVVYDDDDNYQVLLYDFQANPDWSIDRDDGYASWYMYGFALYLHYLREQYFRGDATFVVRMWEGMESPEWAGEPDFEDALDALLADAGRSFLDTVVEFQRWRWYVAGRDDGRHLEEAGAFPDDALPAVEATLDAAVASSTQVRPMMLGSVFVDIEGGADAVVQVALDRVGGASAADVQWVVQALPGIGGADGETLDIDGPTTVALVDGARTLVITALPGPNTSADPDDRSDKRFSVKLEVEPAP